MPRPSSLTVLSLLLGRWGRCYIAVPLTHVRYCRTLTAAQSEAASAAGIFKERDVPLPVHVFGPVDADAGGLTLVVVRLYGTDLGLLWDTVIGVEELRVQGLDGQARIPDVEAAALLPSGDVVQVLDMAALVKRYAAR